MGGKPLTHRQAWLGEKVLLQVLSPALLLVQFSLDQAPTELSFSQPSANTQQVPRPCAGTQNCLTSINFADNSKADHDFGVFRRVPTCREQAGPPGSLCHPVKKIGKPISCA